MTRIPYKVDARARNLLSRPPPTTGRDVAHPGFAGLSKSDAESLARFDPAAAGLHRPEPFDVAHDPESVERLVDGPKPVERILHTPWHTCGLRRIPHRVGEKGAHVTARRPWRGGIATRPTRRVARRGRLSTRPLLYGAAGDVKRGNVNCKDLTPQSPATSPPAAYILSTVSAEARSGGQAPRKCSANFSGLVVDFQELTPHLTTFERKKSLQAQLSVL